jgi:serine protease Do/serine protease DegQ
MGLFEVGMGPLGQKRGVVPFLVVGVVSFFLGSFTARLLLAPLPDLPATSLVGTEGSPFSRAAQRTAPAVVNIRSEGLYGERRTSSSLLVEPDPFFRELFGQSTDHPAESDARVSLGSGVIIDRRGYILTNNHVIRGADRIIVRLSTQEELKATVVGRDPQTDLAVIRVESDRPLPEAPLGDSDRLRVGEWALAIGNPFGLNHTVTVGVISGTGRSDPGVPGYAHFIQTDASINPGNSGGPLLNVEGEVIGINTAIVAPGHGIGFASPINLAKRIARDLIDRGRVARAWLGIGTQVLTGEAARSLQVLPGAGVLVSHVDPKGPGARSGLRPGDVITAIGERKVRSPEEVQRYVTEAAVGSTLSVVIQRHRETLTLAIPVGEKPHS